MAVQTIGRMTLQVGRHKHALVRLLREDPSQEVRKQADLVLKQRGWQKPHWPPGLACRRNVMWRDEMMPYPINIVIYKYIRIYVYIYIYIRHLDLKGLCSEDEGANAEVARARDPLQGQ